MKTILLSTAFFLLFSLKLQAQFFAPYVNDFETDTTGWTIITTGGSTWQWDTLSTSGCNGSKGFILTAGGSANLSTILYSPIFDIVGNTVPEVCFSHLVNATMNQDGIRLEYDLNNNGTWNILGPSSAGTNWHNSPFLSSSGLPGWSGLNSGCMLSSFNNQGFMLGSTSVRYRFVATAISNNPILFFIDEFRFCDSLCVCNTGTGLPAVPSSAPLISIAPNPAKNQITLNLFSENTGSAELTFRNNTGVLFYRHDVNIQQSQKKIEITIDGWPAGLYMVEMKMGNGKSANSRFIKIP